MGWWFYAIVSAVAASATAILSKVGVKDVPSNLATAIRTAVVLVVAWGIVLGSGEHASLRNIKVSTTVFLRPCFGILHERRTYGLVVLRDRFYHGSLNNRDPVQG